MSDKKKKVLLLCYSLFLLVCYLISGLTNSWISTDGEHLGLWQRCTSVSGCENIEQSPSFDVPFLDWFSAVRSFMVLAKIFVFLAMVFQLCNICYDQYFRLKPARIALIFVAIFLIFAIVVFAVERRHIYDGSWDLDWSFYITCVSLIFTIIGIILMHKINDVKSMKKSNRSYNYKPTATVQQTSNFEYSSNSSTNQNATGNYPTNQDVQLPSPVYQFDEVDQKDFSYKVNEKSSFSEPYSNRNEYVEAYELKEAVGSKSISSKSYGSESYTSSESGSDVGFV